MPAVELAADRAGSALLRLLASCFAAALAAPSLAPHASDAQFPDFLNAPPTLPTSIDDGRLPGTRRSSIRGSSRTGSSSASSRTRRRCRSRWFTGGRLVVSSDDARMPLLLLGADSYGRDVFSRLLFGARMSLGAVDRRGAGRAARRRGWSAPSPATPAGCSTTC